MMGIYAFFNLDHIRFYLLVVSKGSCRNTAGRVNVPIVVMYF